MTARTKVSHVGTVLDALGEPRRRAILELVWTEERPAAEIAARFEVTFGAISQHLRVLREAGLVEVRRAGRQRYYRARRTGLGALGTWLEQAWQVRLDRLGALAEAEERDGRK